MLQVPRGNDPWYVVMVTPLIAFFPQSLAYCLHCSQLAPTLHLNIANLQVNEHVNANSELKK